MEWESLQLFNEVNSREMEKEDVTDGIRDNNVFASIISTKFIFQVIMEIQVLADARCLFRAIVHMGCSRNGEEALD